MLWLSADRGLMLISDVIVNRAELTVTTRRHHSRLFHENTSNGRVWHCYDLRVDSKTGDDYNPVRIYLFFGWEGVSLPYCPRVAQFQTFKGVAHSTVN